MNLHYQEIWGKSVVCGQRKICMFLLPCIDLSSSIRTLRNKHTTKESMSINCTTYIGNIYIYIYIYIYILDILYIGEYIYSCEA